MRGRGRGWLRRSWLGVVGIGLLLTVLSSSVAVVADEQAAQAGNCLAAGCDNKWPEEQLCLADRQGVAWLPIDWESGEEPDVVTVKGQGILYYSPSCRAAFADFVLTELDGHVFIPQLWYQAQYGGRRTLPTGPAGNGGQYFKVVDGGPGDLPFVFRSTLVSWDYSVQLCAHDLSGTPTLDPDYNDNIVVGGLKFPCTEWQ